MRHTPNSVHVTYHNLAQQILGFIAETGNMKINGCVVYITDLSTLSVISYL